MKKHFLKIFNRKKGQAMMDYALILALVAICVMSTVSHLSDFNKDSFSLLNRTFEEAQRAYEEEMLNLQNNRTIKEYAAVANGTASAGVAQSWAGSTVYGEDNIGSSAEYDQEVGTGNIVDGSGESTNHPPIARFGFYNDIRPALGRKFQLLNTSYDEDGDRIAKAEWYGVPTESTFKSAGLFTIKLRVADEHGAWSDWYEETFEIENKNPIAVITKDMEFEVLDEADEDLAVNSNKYYLMGTNNELFNFYDTSSYDPDGHLLSKSYWTLTVNDIDNEYETEFGTPLSLTQEKSGPVRVALAVEDQYKGKSEVVSEYFYFFASQRPQIRNITVSDGVNGQYSLDTLEQEDWITEIYPYTTENELQIPASSNDIRISFQIEDDSDVISYYQYKFNGSESDLIPLNKVSQEGQMFHMADLTNDFAEKNGSATLNFRVCDDSDTCSRWTEDIKVIFKSISEVKPLIKDLTITNYSTYDNTPIETEGKNFYVGSFRGTLTIDDVYGNMRSIEELELFLNNEPLDYYDIEKTSGTTYTFYFDITEETEDATLSVKGIYDTSDETDIYEMEDINVYEYVIKLISAILYNAESPGWWTVDLTKEGTENANQISAIKLDQTNGDYKIKVNYESVFNAPITTMDIFIYDNTNTNSETYSVFEEEDIEIISNQEVIFTIDGDELDSFLSLDSYNYLKVEIADEKDNYSNYSRDNGSIVKLIKFDTYTPYISNFTIKDIDGTEGQTEKTYSRGIITVDYTVEDYFFNLREDTKNEGINYTYLNENIVGLTSEKTQVSPASNGRTFTQKHTVDTHTWEEWTNENSPTLSLKQDYLTYNFPQLDISLENYSPHEIYNVEYKAVKFDGQYTLHLKPAKYKDYFDIEEVHFSIKIGDEENTYVIDKEHFTITEENEEMQVKFFSEKLPSRVYSYISVYLVHSNNVDNSNTYTNNLFVEKPYEITVEETTHRTPSTTTNGFVKLFTNKSTIDTTTDTDLFANISLKEENEVNAPRSHIDMTHTDRGGFKTVYAEYDRIAITPNGTIVFANENITNANADTQLINATASGNTSESVVDDTYGHDIFTLFSGDITFDNTPGSGSGIYYRTNTHYLDTLEQNKVNSTTIKYINICSSDDYDSIAKTCSTPFSVEATIYDNGSVIVHYDTIPESIKDKSVIGGKIDKETDDAYFATAYGQYNGEFSGKTLKFNVLPDYYQIPPVITDVIYEQSDSTTKETIDPITSETTLAKYTIYFDNPDNLPIILHEGSLTQFQYDSDGNKYQSSQSSIVIDGTATDSGYKYVFESKTVIKRATASATIKIRLKYSDNPIYYTAWFEKEDYTYVGPIIINFTASVPTHIEPTTDIDGYTPLDFAPGSWTADSTNYYDDWSSNLLPLGFEMAYLNGERIDSISVSTNSLIRFGAVAQTSYTAQPVTGLLDDTLAVLWYDLDFQGTSTDPSNPKGIFYKRFLDAPVPYISLKYLNMTVYYYGVEPFNYEVQIYQDGKIIVHYSKEVPVKMYDEDGDGEYTDVATTVAFKKTMLMGYGSLVVPSTGELDDKLDFVSQRKLLGWNQQNSDSYVNMDTVGRSIQINLNQCNLGDDACGEYTPPTTVTNSTKYSYTGATETITLTAGTYRIQTWGASGGAAGNGYSSVGSSGGKGGYAEGTIKLNSPTTLYLNIGGTGNGSTAGFNGGGKATGSFYIYNEEWDYYDTATLGSGGGATDVRIGSNDLANRIIVAGGGGGGGISSAGGAGGGLIGIKGVGEFDGLGGDINNIFKTNSNTVAFPGTLGYGGNNISQVETTAGGAGGGGYYGGNSGTNGGSGGGGSGYVYINNMIKNPTVLAGNTAIPTTDNSGTKLGHNGNGYVIITKLSNDSSLPAFDTNTFMAETNYLKEMYPRYSNINVGEQIKSSSTTVSNVKLDPGSYKLQVWGAQGGYSGGKGGYSEGVLTLAETVDAYLYVGGQGNYKTSSSATTIAGGANGGGASYGQYNGSGGGATDIRLFQDSLANRIIVAGGGGGKTKTNTGGVGGGSNGTNGSGTEFGTGGSQITVGTTSTTLTCITPANANIGASYNCSTTESPNGGAGGGGGYFGGGAGINGSGAGGGSGYINENLKSAYTLDGTNTFPSPYANEIWDDETDSYHYEMTETGHPYSGFITITKFSNDTAYPIVLDTFADFKIGDVREYDLTETTETVTLDPGIYKLQVWGAQGGQQNNSYPGGLGGYAEGVLNVNSLTDIYINVGGQGTYSNSAVSNGGYNGGGSGSRNGSSGGGASDIRLGGTDLSNRIIVAGGGGGGSYVSTSNGSGGAGGGLTGLSGTSNSGSSYIGAGATQSTGNAIGQGGNGTYTGTSANNVTNGGGGGYYGGYASTGKVAGGGGGSSYISSMLTNGQLIAGKYSMPSSTSITGIQTGQTGNGHIRITRIASTETININQEITYTKDNTTKELLLPIGTYEIQAWGASGGNGNGTYKGGLGGYATGTLTISTPSQIFITVGGQGANANSGTNSIGGFNGGGQGTIDSGSGGGATDIRLGGGNLTDRILVAGAGGGGSYYNNFSKGSGGAGGGLTGLDSPNENSSTYYGVGGSQSAGGNGSANSSVDDVYIPGSLGLGGYLNTSMDNKNYLSGGGGAGYYGGSSGGGAANGGGGGSSFYDTTILTNYNTIAGNEEQPSPTTGGTQTGNLGDGYVIIKRIN